MNIIVTGGAGFIGSNLCHRLINKNNVITCLDNLFTGSLDNISDLLDNENFKVWIQYDGDRICGLVSEYYNGIQIYSK